LSPRRRVTARPHVRSHCTGVTAVELLATVAVTAVVAAVLASAYRTHVVRAQVAAAIAQTAATRARVEEAYAKNGEPPIDRRPAGLAADPSSGTSGVVSAIEVDNGRIDISFGDAADPAIRGGFLSLTPYETAGREVVWVCGNKVAGAGLKPLGFAGGSVQAVQRVAGIEPRYLPTGCR
jgi:Tfp pilus assembly major pilin PilA